MVISYTLLSFPGKQAKNTVRTSKKAQQVTITKMRWLNAVGEIIVVYSKNHTKTQSVGKIQC
jgi:hypothetical protein